MRKMKLLTDDLEARFGEYPFYSQDGKGEEAEVVCKFFNPYGLGTWYVLEAEKQADGDYLFFGYVESPLSPDFDEYGYFSLGELEVLKIPIRINGEIIAYGSIERDLYMGDLKMGDILKN